MTTPDLSAYRAVHRALRAGAAGLAAATAGIARADARRRRAFARYWSGYAGEVLTHHTIEDDFVFPALVAVAPEARVLIDRTDADHHHLDELMDDVGAAVARLRAGHTAPELGSLMAGLTDHMESHLGFEDEEILPLIEDRFEADEWARLDEQATRSLGLGAQAVFTVPFIVSAMAPAEVEHALGTAPLPMRVLYRTFRGQHARLTRRALGRPLQVVA